MVEAAHIMMDRIQKRIQSGARTRYGPSSHQVSPPTFQVIQPYCAATHLGTEPFGSVPYDLIVPENNFIATLRSVVLTSPSCLLIQSSSSSQSTVITM